MPRVPAVFLAVVVILGLPPPGPPPDPSKGETYDGRAPATDPLGKKLALALPRAALAPPRVALRLLETPARQVVKLFGGDGAGRDPLRQRRGFSLAGSIEIPALGVRMWSRDLFGPEVATSSVLFITGGTEFQEMRFDIDPNRDRELGLAFSIRGRNRDAERYFGLVPDIPADATANELRRRVHVAFVESGAALRYRPGGASGQWRVSLGGGGAIRRYFEASKDSADLEMLPGDGFSQFLSTELVLERLGRWDPSRRAPALDVTLSAEPSWGVGTDRSRFVTMMGRTAVGVPLGDGISLLLRTRVVALESYGEGEVGFWDIPEVGGEIHRGFVDGRFRGPTTAVASFDVRWPIKLRLDGFAFFEYGGAFGERFEGFGPERMRPGIGTGVRLYRGNGFLLRTFVAWGVGDGPRISLSFDARP
jgi:hypothetical protein